MRIVATAIPSQLEGLQIAATSDIGASKTRFPSNPLIIRVPSFLIFGFNKGTPN